MHQKGIMASIHNGSDNRDENHPLYTNHGIIFPCPSCDEAPKGHHGLSILGLKKKLRKKLKKKVIPITNFYNYYPMNRL